MNLTSLERLSVLACVTGLALAAICLAVAWIGAPRPEWLPMTIAAIAGFEMFIVLNSLRRRGAEDGSNG